MQYVCWKNLNKSLTIHRHSNYKLYVRITNRTTSMAGNTACFVCASIKISWSQSNENDKTNIFDRFFFYYKILCIKIVLKCIKIIKKIWWGTYRLKIKIKKEWTIFVDLVALCGSSNFMIKCGQLSVWLTLLCQLHITSVWV